MLARLTLCTALILLPGCASVAPKPLGIAARPGVGAGTSMVQDDAFMLQDIAAVQLVDLAASATIDDLCDEMAAQAAAGPLGKATYEIECHSRKRLIRVLYTEDAVSHAIHFGILERAKANGTRAVSLQPIVAWVKTSGGLATVPVVKSSASGLVTVTGPDLRTLAAQAAAKL